MATTPPNPSEGLTLSLPPSLTIKDLITIISMVVSITLAWAAVAEKIAVLEQDHKRLADQVKKLNESHARMLRAVRKLEAKQQDDELLLDQVFILLKRPVPRRRATELE